MIKKASDITLNDMLELHNKDGDFLRLHRMIISSAEAWGALIRDLIMALGIERAKRFLLRYGWHCGVHEARIFKNMFQWEDDKEWVLAGSKMHDISGRVSSVPIKLNIQTKKGIFDVEGYWFNSYEATQYLKYFSHHHEPVCYFLVGYAGGYCSESFGKRIIFKEVACSGKGDEHCRFAGKTVELWGDEIADELVDYEQEDIGDELDRAYKRIEKQREVLKRAGTLSQSLTQIVLQGKGLDAIAETLGETLNCSVLLENQHFETIAGFGDVTGYSLKSLMENKKALSESQLGSINRMLQEHCATEFELHEPFPFPHKRLTIPIVIRNQTYGFISVIKNEGEVGELEAAFLKQTANICAFQMLNEKTAIETEQRMKGELLDQLLTQPVENSYAAKKLSYLGYNLRQPHYVFIFHLEDPCMQLENEHAITVKRDDIINYLLKDASVLDEKILLSSRLDRIHTLVPESLIKKQCMPVKKYGEGLLKRLGNIVQPLKVVLGISDCCKDITQLNDSFNDSLKAIEIAKIKRQDNQVVLSSELGHLAILLDAKRPDELERYASKLLGQLYEYDKQYSTEYLQTLYNYLSNECNLYKTARFMNVSISGMRYRLGRIQELSGIDVSQSTTRFEIQMALEIYLVLGKIQFHKISN
ncbi:XylR N-terminal domain-containing protein [uncultured Brevibacillus sp.]|uniref:XylR N-terminal domain-containing protein n=1 Tax=uncultured Brevibacillus sp. TaxID=169970 RepID=UPI0025998A33|nr:XylR N-terminal domain-containing protein [uncultured Brevibacillus sp.]